MLKHSSVRSKQKYRLFMLLYLVYIEATIQFPTVSNINETYSRHLGPSKVAVDLNDSRCSNSI